MSLIDLVDPDRNEDKFNLGQKLAAAKLRQAIKTQGLPEGFSAEGVHIRKLPGSGDVYISNKAEQMCMFNDGKLEIYYLCPKCRNGGFKNTISHSSRCDQQSFGNPV